MPAASEEIETRRTTALAAIQTAFGTEQDEYGATLFVSHHLAEIEDSFCRKHLGTAQPELLRVLDILELRSHWGDEDEDGLDVFDFTLPDAVTNHVIRVQFDETGEVQDMSMES